MFGSSQTAEIAAGIVLGLKLVLGFIGVLTLAIGGIGVMNIMFVYVTERTREIGIRKALGARRRAILLQFLLEGMVTTVAGGAAGVRSRGCWSALFSPQPVPVRAARRCEPVADIHLVLSLRAARRLQRHPDGRRSRQRAASRAARLEAGPDRGAAGTSEPSRYAASPRLNSLGVWPVQRRNERWNAAGSEYCRKNAMSPTLRLPSCRRAFANSQRV